MKNNFTPVIVEKKQKSKNIESGNKLTPSEKTLTFLKLFARNYQVEKDLPEGIQGIVLS